MRMRFGWLSCAALCAFTAGTVQAQIDGLVTHERVFNDFTTTTLVTTNGNSVNQGPTSLATIAESVYTEDGVGGSFANRHDFILSSDGGATDHVFDISDSWRFSTLVTADAGTDSNPNFSAKEAGIRINDAVTGDSLFIVKTNGEIIACCAGSPFQNISGGSAPDYVPGTPILLEMTMYGTPLGGAPNQVEFHVDRTPGIPGGDFFSGLLSWSNLEGGPVNYTLGLYGQSPPNLANPADFLNVQFSDIEFQAIPEPATAMMSLIGIAGLLLRRRIR